MTEDIEVNVRQIHDESEQDDQSQTEIDENIQKVLLAGVGALAIAYDEADKMIKRFVERGEEVQKDSPQIMNGVMDGFRRASQQVQESTESGEVSQKLDTIIQNVLYNINVPSRQEVEDLNAKIDQLTEQIATMNKAK